METERLVIRWPVPGDAGPLAERRSDAEVADLQSWEAPFPLERAQAMIDELVDVGGLRDDTWSMLTVVERASGTIVGDLAVRPSWGGRAAEVGYTLARAHWGRGYASEAVAALVRRLFDDHGVTRVGAMLHPDNHASAMVLERTGFQYEGRTVNSFWVGEANTDDLLYGMSRDMWRDWVDRPTRAPASVRLVEIGPGNARAMTKLRTHKSQERFVAPMLVSFADALFPEIVDGAPVVPWLRGVEADGELVGFVMVASSTTAHPEPYLWRLLVDRRHQRRGIGTSVLDLVVEDCRRRGDRSLLTSWEEGRGSPRPVYERYGFVPTGEVLDGETEARLVFAP